LRLRVPYRDVDAGNRFHDNAAAPAFIGLCDAALERRPAARTAVHLFVDALGEHRILADTFRRELVLDDGSTIGGVPRAAPMPVSPLSVSTRMSVASLLTFVPRSVR
jgi:hypothetical protein